VNIYVIGYAGFYSIYTTIFVARDEEELREQIQHHHVDSPHMIERAQIEETHPVVPGYITTISE